MKTIEVSDEMYEKLIGLATEMTTQDPRGTCMPHMFQIRTLENVAAYPGNGESVWRDGDGGRLGSEEEIKDYMSEVCQWGDKYKDKMFSNLKSDDLVDALLEENGWYKLDEEENEVYTNTFFTAKACQEHIDKNDYHYSSPIVYLKHAWMNPEMELVSEFLCNLVGKSNHR